MISLTDIVATSRRIGREFSSDRSRPRERRYTPIYPVSCVRHWLSSRLSRHFFRVPKSLR